MNGIATINIVLPSILITIAILEVQVEGCQAWPNKSSLVLTLTFLQGRKERTWGRRGRRL